VSKSWWESSVTRRDFARALSAGLCAGALRPRFLLATEQKKTVTIGSLFPAQAPGPEVRSVRQGFELGIDEATRASVLFSQPLDAVQATYSSAGDIRVQVDRLKLKNVSAVIGGASEADCRSIGEACTEAGLVYVNPASRADSLRRESCSPFVFHVEASDAMYASAAKTAASPVIVLWHPSLTRYGASQLNDRYKARFGEAMTGSAWAGWVAVKVAWETSLRTSAAGAQALAAALANDATQFDGHKGAPLSFRSWDHQLRQPLYAVANNAGKETVTDVPDLARSSRPARQLLDELGDSASAHACKETQS
jgi:ABC-type branched-subunit amino acid transport system substrate-binding protein